ncbi:hypothetical protein CAter10_4985 [Collimonas arenae]|nr:hypothetical protein CAter10_4985 [Collimonas arenae]
MVAGAVLGSIANNAGIWIKPPPPTTASIKPARKLAAAKMKKSGNSSGMIRYPFFNYAGKVDMKAVGNDTDK